MLAFAREHRLQARVAGRVRQVLGVDQTRYYQLLAALLDRPQPGDQLRLGGSGRRPLRDRRQRLRRPAPLGAPAASVAGWMAVADGLVALYLAAHIVLHRPSNSLQGAVVAVPLVVVGIALGWLALRIQPRPGPVPLEQPAVTRGLSLAPATALLAAARRGGSRLTLDRVTAGRAWSG